jgi:RNA polymerase sigma factor (sigma-70 family)
MFLDHFQSNVYRNIVSFLSRHNCKDAYEHGKEVCQDTFTEVYKEFLARYENLKEADFSNPKGWVNSIAIHEAYQHFRKNCDKQEVDKDFNQNYIDDETSSDLVISKIINQKSLDSSRADSIQARLEAEEVLDSIEKYIFRLPSIKKAAFILRMNGATHKEIGEALNLTESAASKMVNRLTFEINQKFNPNFGGV